MRLSRQQRKNLKEALIDAFPDKASLEQMLSLELDKNLDEIAFGSNLQDIVFKLIQKAESQGWITDLLRAARESNPGNPKLQTITQELSIGSVTIPSTEQQKDRKDLLNGVKLEVNARLKQSLFASLLITALVTVARFSGTLQGFELQAFDQMMRVRPDEGRDPRLLVITIDDEDLKYQDDKGMKKRGSLSDTALYKILEKLEPLQPSVIGLDIIHDFPISGDQPELANELENTDNFIAICIGDDPKLGDKGKGIEPPAKVPPDRLGFADVVEDNDGILRRHLLSATFSADAICKTNDSLSLKLALYYLVKKGTKLQKTDFGYSQLEKTRLQRLQTIAGGYQNLQNEGHQILLNYRSRNIADQISLRDILENNFDSAKVKDRIVLVGVTASSVKDDFSTPYSISQQPDQKMRGVFVQAQMVSQIISAELDGRPLLGVLPWWGDVFYIWLWSLAGSVFVAAVLQKLTWRYRKIIFILASIGFILIISYGICLFVLIKGYWLPFIPSIIAALGTGIIMFNYNHKFPYKRQ